MHFKWIQGLSVTQSCPTLWDPMDCSTQDFPILHHPPEFLKLTSIESVMPSNHLIVCRHFSSCLQFFPASGSFPVSQLFTSGGQSIGASASASVLPMNIQGWFHLRLTSLTSLLSMWFLSVSSKKRKKRVSSNITQFKNLTSLVLSLLYGSTLTSVHDYWKNHSLD